MIMQDVSCKDTRSTKAMLKGRGDGRECSWLAFEKLHSNLTLEDLFDAFTKAVRYGRLPSNAIFIKPPFRKAYLFIMLLVAVLI